jgi:hypothetical protein
MVGGVVAPQGLFSADFWGGRACPAHDRRAIAFGYAVVNCLRRLRRKVSLQPARFSLLESEPLESSRRATSRARRRRMAMLAAPLSLRLRAESSLNPSYSRNVCVDSCVRLKVF